MVRTLSRKVRTMKTKARSTKHRNALTRAIDALASTGDPTLLAAATTLLTVERAIDLDDAEVLDAMTEVGRAYVKRAQQQPVIKDGVVNLQRAREVRDAIFAAAQGTVHNG